MLFSCSGGTGTDMTKGVPGHVMPKLCFLRLGESTGYVVHSGASEA
jgi:hypothetical protein